MRRATLIASLALPTALAVAATLPALFPSARLAKALENRLCAPRNIACDIGAAHLSLLPLPHINAQNVTLALHDQPGVRRAQSVQADLSLSALFKGQLAFSHLTLNGAELAVDTKALRGADGTAIVLIESLTAQTQRWTHLPVQHIALNDTRLVDLQGGEWADQASITLDLPGKAGALSFNGSARWRGEIVRVTARLAQPLDLVKGGRSDVLLGFTAPLISASLEGVANGGTLPQVNGQFTMTSSNPSAMAAWFGEADRMWPVTGFATTGSARFARELVTLSMNKFTLGKAAMEGNVAFRKDANGVQLTGTLATDNLDLPWIDGALGPRFDADDDGGWPLLNQERPVHIDLRLSAGQAKLGRVAVSNLGLALIVRERKADLVLAGADYAGGRLKGRLALTHAQNHWDVKLQSQLDGVDMGRALAPFGTKRMNGTMNAQLMIEARGTTGLELLRSLDGRATIGIKQGDIVGINVPEILRRIEKRPLLTALDLRGGRTPFEHAHINLRLANGIAVVSETSFTSPATVIELSGSLYIPERIVALKGVAAPHRTEGLALPFDIKGSFDEPSLIPDVRALIRRSGAAAPFFAPSSPVPQP